MDLFKKSTVIGVSVTPGIGLEAAEINFASGTIIKYGVRKLEYNKSRMEISDLDLFKEALVDLFAELNVTKGTEVYLNMPTINFKVKDYPASFSQIELTNAVEADVVESGYFSNVDPIIDAAVSPLSTMQSCKVAYSALQIQSVSEIVIMLKELGYKIGAIDVSVNSTINALMYRHRIEVEPDTNWVLMLIDDMYCRVISMVGFNYIDATEDKISIGEVLDDDDNYGAVINTITPILKKLPSKLLCIVSETNVISAEVLASKINYNAAIVYQEANCYAKEPFVNISTAIDESDAKTISLGLIGIAIYKDFAKYTSAKMNLFNISLGDLYESEQPPAINFLGKKYVLTAGLLIMLYILFSILSLVVGAVYYVPTKARIIANNNETQQILVKQRKIEQFLAEHKNISADYFDEGDEIRIGLTHNQGIYSYYNIVGTEIPRKLWLTHLKLSDKTTIEGQADNLQSVYAFFRNIKDYRENPNLKLEKLGLASQKGVREISENLDTESILTSLNADFYEFVITDEPQNAKTEKKSNKKYGNGLELLESID